MNDPRIIKMTCEILLPNGTVHGIEMQLPCKLATRGFNEDDAENILNHMLLAGYRKAEKVQNSHCGLY